MAPSVAEFYAGKNIFITGATGFVGKVLIEKLLRCCPNVDTIYLLLRPKKGVSSEERLRDLCNHKCFDRIREHTPERFKKLVLVAGDILEEGLGLTEEDTNELRERCHIVFHSAACVRFDQRLKDAINLNTGGTKRVLQLSTTLKHLIAHVHLSTAYCRCELPELEEKLYPAMHKPERILDVCQWMDDDLLAHMEPKIIGTEPNTYSYTKAITEDLVADYADKIPIAIGRPSIVSPAWKEPFPGWVDNLNGPTGLVIGSGKGVIRTMHCEPSYVADAIPVDVCANACILIAKATALNPDKKIKIYNITLSGIISMKWQDIIELGQKWVNVYPHTIALWYPGGSLKSYWLSHQIDVILFHIIPAYIVDALLMLFGRKTIMVKIQKRISNGLAVLQSYTVKEWHFINRNFRALRENISKEDDQVFFTDVSTLSVDAYLKDYILGAREYCCKEDPSTLPRARKIHRIRFFLHYGVKILFYVFLAWWVYSNSHILTNSVQYLDKTLKTWMPGVRQSKIVIDEL